jgi:hypothetical protein
MMKFGQAEQSFKNGGEYSHGAMLQPGSGGMISIPPNGLGRGTGGVAGISNGFVAMPFNKPQTVIVCARFFGMPPTAG